MIWNNVNVNNDDNDDEDKNNDKHKDEYNTDSKNANDRHKKYTKNDNVMSDIDNLMMAITIAMNSKVNINDKDTDNNDTYDRNSCCNDCNDKSNNIASIKVCNDILKPSLQ